MKCFSYQHQECYLGVAQLDLEILRYSEVSWEPSQYPGCLGPLLDFLNPLMTEQLKVYCLEYPVPMLWVTLTSVGLDYVGDWWCGVTKLCLTLVTQWTVAPQASMSVDFSRLVCWSGLLLFGCSVVCDSLQPHRLQHARLPVLYQLLELAQTHVHWVGDAVQPSHLSSPSPPALDLSQHQDLFKWVNSSYQVAKVLELQLHHQSFQWIFRIDFL